MNPVIIGNLISLVGCTLMVLVGFLRKKETILTVQCFQFGIQATANLTLGGVTGFVAGIVSIVRNLVFFRGKKSFWLKAAFMTVQILLSANALGKGWVEWLPVFAAAVYTWFLDTKSEVTLKISIIGAQVFWLIYDICYLNYISAAFDAFTILSNLIGILMIKKNVAEKT